jgi:hypothetical protein
MPGFQLIENDGPVLGELAWSQDFDLEMELQCAQPPRVNSTSIR